MIKVRSISCVGWTPAIQGMRNPMNSWDKSDSRFVPGMLEDENNYEPGHFEIGPNDLALMKKLCKGGPDDRKFLRMIVVWTDITAPLYWWKEFDTYKVGTVTNSCSTMHKIHAKEFEFSDFSIENIGHNEDSEYLHPERIFEEIIQALNLSRKRYLETKDKKYWWQMIQLLPSSYNQKRTVMLNYEVLRNMYKARKDHKLYEWHDFCRWIESLPYSNELIVE